jgi:zinc transport system substrate-binding protein
MKRNQVNWFYLLAAGLALGLVFTACSAPATAKLKVVTSTSLMEYIVKQVGGGQVEVSNIVPPNQHPGNFDIKPGDIQKLSNANLFLLHGWPGEGYADKLIASANNPNLTVIKATAEGNWMIPSVQSAATDKDVQALSQADSQNSAAYQKAAEAYKQRIQAKDSEIKSRLAQANVASVKIIASVRQADFLQWAGFNVVGTFGPADPTPQVTRGLIDKGKPAGVSIVVNNLQDAPDAGKAVAQDVGAANLNLSNVPGGFNNTESWEKAIDENINRLLGAIRK